MKHTAFFGDGEKTFALNIEQVRELERKAGVGFGIIVQRAFMAQSSLDEVIDVIRLGLVGGGTSPKDAQALVDAYGTPTPWVERYALATDIIDAVWNGKVEAPAPDTQDNLRQAAATGDLAAALRADIIAAYAEADADDF